MILNIFPALTGDSLLIKWQGADGYMRNILIDGGVTNTYNQSLKREMQLLLDQHEVLDLVILSHIDSDHIGGLLRLVNEIVINRLPDNLIGTCWFNSARVLSQYFQTIDNSENAIALPHVDKRISMKQGNTLEKFLEHLNIYTNSKPILAPYSLDIDGVKIDIISPSELGLRQLSQNWQTEINPAHNVPLASPQTDYNISIRELIERPFEEDRGITNGSSIALLLTHEEKRLLLLADAHPSTIIKCLEEKGYSANNKLKVDYVKVSHHGSKHNTCESLLGLLDCNRFIISTNGNNTHGLPHKEALSRIVNYNYQRGQKTELIFNYFNGVTSNIFSENEMNEFNFHCSYQNQISL